MKLSTVETGKQEDRSQICRLRIRDYRLVFRPSAEVIRNGSNFIDVPRKVVERNEQGTDLLNNLAYLF